MPTKIGRDEVCRLLAEGAQLVEVLPAEEYAEEHLPGAINISLKKLDHGKLLGLLRCADAERSAREAKMTTA